MLHPCTVYTCLVIQEQNITLQLRFRWSTSPGRLEWKIEEYCYNIILSEFDHWKMERKVELVLSCLFFSSCSADANSSVFVMSDGGEVGCWATASAAAQMTVAISPPLNSNLREEK